MCDYSVNYPKYVKHIIFVGNKDKNIRYGLEIYLENKGCKQALVILKNPSIATETKGDTTICDGVLKTLNKLKYQKVIITNIIPYYATNINDIINDTDVLTNTSIYEYNKEYIRKCINSSIDIFVGWGTIDSNKKEFYKSKIKDIEGIIKQSCYCSKTNSDGTPTHPLYSWNNSINSLNDFEIYNIQYS